ncbi:MAG: hypothetical protein ACK5TQ_06135 [Acetobacteraceae bacterium]|jgi:hypothetical protein
MGRKPKAGAGEPAPPAPEAGAETMKPETGLFGLPQASLLGFLWQAKLPDMGLALELMATPETKLAEARALFETLCRMVGDDKARAQWQAIAKRRRGRPAKSDEQRAALFYAMFDAVAGCIGRYDELLGRVVQQDTIVKMMAEIFTREGSAHSEEAKAQEIRRALRARAEARTGAPVVTKIGE